MQFPRQIRLAPSQWAYSTWHHFRFNEAETCSLEGQLFVLVLVDLYEALWQYDRLNKGASILANGLRSVLKTSTLYLFNVSWKASRKSLNWSSSFVRQNPEHPNINFIRLSVQQFICTAVATSSDVFLGYLEKPVWHHYSLVSLHLLRFLTLRVSSAIVIIRIHVYWISFTL